MSVTWFVSTAVAPIYRKPDFTSEIVSQGLIWERVTIIDQHNSWVYIKMEDIGRCYIFYPYNIVWMLDLLLEVILILTSNSIPLDFYTLLQNKLSSYVKIQKLP